MLWTCPWVLASYEASCLVRDDEEKHDERKDVVARPRARAYSQHAKSAQSATGLSDRR